MTYNPTLPQRIRAKLLRMQHDDRREQAKSTSDAMVQTIRAKLNSQHPQVSPEEIEAMLSRRLAAGMKPTQDAIQPAQRIPKDVVAARRAARKRQVASGRHLRR